MERAGHECVGACEIDEYARRVYGKHFSDITIWKDATKLDPAELPEFDCLVGGFPCQAFSIAGKRRGFDDTRGSLFFEIARIAKERRPQYLLLENVKGLLNHDEGRTFRVILATLSELGYDVEWQVLNSKYFVPQNRERVFIVGHLGGFSGRKIFPLGEVGKKPVCPRREEQEGGKGISEQRSSALQSTPYKGSATYVSAIDASYYKGPDGKRTMIEEPKLKRTEGNPNVYNTDAQAGKIYNVNGISPTVSGQRVNSQGFIEVPKLKQLNETPHDTGRIYDPDGIARSLRANSGGMGSKTGLYAIPVLTPDRANKRQNGRRFKTEGEPAFTLTAQDKHGVSDGTRIRRLTPLECERLQGFPDNWTEGLSDTQRYKCCGNAVTVPVVEYIANNLVL